MKGYTKILKYICEDLTGKNQYEALYEIINNDIWFITSNRYVAVRVPIGANIFNVEPLQSTTTISKTLAKVERKKVFNTDLDNCSITDHKKLYKLSVDDYHFYINKKIYNTIKPDAIILTNISNLYLFMDEDHRVKAIVMGVINNE